MTKLFLILLKPYACAGDVEGVLNVQNDINNHDNYIDIYGGRN